MELSLGIIQKDSFDGNPSQEFAYITKDKKAYVSSFFSGGTGIRVVTKSGEALETDNNNIKQFDPKKKKGYKFVSFVK